MASTDLLFAGAPLAQPADLVFGDSDAGGVISDAVIAGGDLAFTLAFECAVALGIAVDGTGWPLPALAFESAVVYRTNTPRPTVGQVRSAYQDGAELVDGAAVRQQDTDRLPVGWDASWQDGVPLSAAAVERWRDSQRLQNRAAGRYQDGTGLQRGVDAGYHDAQRRPNAQHVRYQDGTGLQRGASTRYQDALRRPNAQHARYQDARPYTIGVRSRNGTGRALLREWDTAYQDAMRPPAGMRVRPVIPVDPGTPCYTPSGHLVFATPWSADTNLVFVCDGHGGGQVVPGATVVVPVRRVYVVLNNTSLRRVDGDIAIPTFGMTLSLDMESWTWSFSASVPGAAYDDLVPSGAGDPVEVEALINGTAYRWLVEGIARERVFATSGLRLSGRGIAAQLDKPYAPIMNFGNAEMRTAQQLIGDVLSLNGVPLDWAVDFQLDDWNVPGGLWAKQGTYIEAVNEIAAAAGGYVQPTPTGQTLRVLHRYNGLLPRDWSTVPPDYELPASVVTRESIEWMEKPRYDRVYVSGVQGGILGNVKLDGTAGDNVAPMVTDTLITQAAAARQRGIAILGDTGRIANVGLRLPILTETGVIPPGKWVRYVDGGVTRLGITRSVQVDIAKAEAWQTIGVESHESL